MKLSQNTNTRYKITLCSLLITLLLNFTTSFNAYSQIDYTYGRNLKGIRLSAGVGFVFLQTHFSKNFTNANFVGNLDYDLSPYFSIGGEGQVGYLQGVDDKNHLPYSSSTNHYLTANINAKAAIGLFYDFPAESVVMEAVKRIYIGAGIGGFRNSIVLKPGNNPSIQPYGNPITNDKCLVFPFSLGTNIDLLGLTKKDMFVITPEYQFSIIHSPYADGFISSAYSKATVGYYTMLALKLKYKF